MDDTIAAIATPFGEGGIAIIRVSGPKALKIADAVFTLHRGRPSALPSHTIHLGEVRNGDRLIDQAMLTVMRAPRTYTTEDTIEINCHGGMLTVRSILALCLTQGARLAEPGEFTKRAFLNGRLDLTQAEAVMDLISAKTERAHHAAASALVGHLSQRVEAERQRLITVLAHIEAQIDFPEDDLAPNTRDELLHQVDDICRSLNNLLATRKEGKILRQGVSVAIIGRPNVGKSSLMNALLQQDRSIVSEIPGTTRDTIDEIASIRGIPIRLIDTAGIRNRQGKLEAAGVDRSYKILYNSDLRLLIFDSSRPFSSEDQKLSDICSCHKTILVENKVDLRRRIQFPNDIEKHRRIKISCATSEGVNELKAAIEEAAYDGADHSVSEDVVINERHYEAIRRAIDALTGGVDEMKTGKSLEVIAQSYRAALAAIGEVVGKTSNEDLLNTIFSSFCIGK